MSGLKKNFEQPGDRKTIKRLIRKSRSTAGPITDKLNIDALNIEERLKYLVKSNSEGYPNWVDEIRKQDREISRLREQLNSLRKVVRQINELSNTRDFDE